MWRSLHERGFVTRAGSVVVFCVVGFSMTVGGGFRLLFLFSRDSKGSRVALPWTVVV